LSSAVRKVQHIDEVWTPY